MIYASHDPAHVCVLPVTPHATLLVVPMNAQHETLQVLCERHGAQLALINFRDKSLAIVSKICQHPNHGPRVPVQLAQNICCPRLPLRACRHQHL